MGDDINRQKIHQKLLTNIGKFADLPNPENIQQEKAQQQLPLGCVDAKEKAEKTEIIHGY